jgi:hypothetical protein
MARNTGERDRSHALAVQALELARQRDQTWYISELLILHGFQAEDAAEFERARVFHERALAIARQANDLVQTAFALLFAAWQQLLSGDLTGSEPKLQEALAMFRSVPEGSLGVAITQSQLSEISRRRGNYVRAAELEMDRLALTWDLWGLRWSLEGLAIIALDCREFRRGALLLGAADAHRERCGTALTPRQLPDQERDVARARAALGDRAFDEAWNDGRRMSLTAACAEAALVASSL